MNNFSEVSTLREKLFELFGGDDVSEKLGTGLPIQKTLLQLMSVSRAIYSVLWVLSARVYLLNLFKRAGSAFLLRVERYG